MNEPDPVLNQARVDAARQAASRRSVIGSLALAPFAIGWPLEAIAQVAKRGPDAPPARFEAAHSIVIEGTKVDYRAVSEETYLYGATGPIGSVFSFSYLRAGIRNVDERPVLFIFNGGPGASSVWLHLGILGPRTVRLDHDVNPSVVPPFDLVDNHACLLDVADLVFIDPVGTGFSRILGEGKPADFFGVEEDARAIAQFVDAWLSRHDRWSSPKYLVGESYGTVRAAVMQQTLMGGPNYGGALRAISLNGVALIGAVLTPSRLQSPDTEAEMLLPSLAATAWYHNRIDRAGRGVEAVVAEATAFASGAYRQALRDGSHLTPDQRHAVAEKISAFIGLSPQDILRSDLRISADYFSSTLLDQDGLSVGIYDSRYTLPRPPSGVKLDPVGDDPAMARYTPGFAAAWHSYMFRELGIRLDRPYGTIVWSGLNNVWRYERTDTPAGQTYASDLALGMRRNPRLRLLVASGYFDLATPLLATETALAQAEAPLDRIHFAHYQSGHMAYFGGTGEAFLADLRKMLRDSM